MNGCETLPLLWDIKVNFNFINDSLKKWSVGFTNKYFSVKFVVHGGVVLLASFSRFTYNLAIMWQSCLAEQCCHVIHGLLAHISKDTLHQGKQLKSQSKQSKTGCAAVSWLSQQVTAA